jgi:hypothetical protein
MFEKPPEDYRILSKQFEDGEWYYVEGLRDGVWGFGFTESVLNSPERVSYPNPNRKWHNIFTPKEIIRYTYGPTYFKHKDFLEILVEYDRKAEPMCGLYWWTETR